VLFGHLSEDQLEQVAPLTRCLRFAQGEAVVVEGDQGETMFQVVSGALEVQKLIEGRTKTEAQGNQLLQQMRQMFSILTST